MRRSLGRRLWLLAGVAVTAIGIVGIFLPVLPTTPFLLVAAFCFARSSARCYRWLLTNRLFGDFFRNYLEGRGLPLRVKLLTILFLWAGIGLSAGLAVQITWVRVLLLIVGAGVTLHICLIRPRR